MNMKKKEKEREREFERNNNNNNQKMCSNQQRKNRNNVFNELAPTMKYRTRKKKKGDLLETTLFFQNEDYISVFMSTTVRRELIFSSENFNRKKEKKRKEIHSHKKVKFLFFFYIHNKQ